MRTFLSTGSVYTSALSLIRTHPELRDNKPFKIIIGSDSYTVAANLNSLNQPCPLVLQPNGSWQSQY